MDRHRHTERQTDTQTDTHRLNWNYYLLHTWMVTRSISVKCKPPACREYGLHKIWRDVDILLWLIFLIWPWPWPNDLDTQTWPRYGQNLPAYQKWSFYVKGSKIIAWTDRNTDRQTDRQTDMTENITYPHTQVVIREIFEKKLLHRTLQN